MALDCARGVSGWILEKFLLKKSGGALETTAQGDSGITISGHSQEKGRCGREGHDLVGMVIMS